MQSAGVPTSLEPNCSKVAGAHPVTTAGARADTLTVLQDRLLLLNASVTHCCADTCVERAAATAGSAAEVRVQKKVRKYALHGPSGYDFTPLVVISKGHQCTRPRMRCSRCWGTLPRTVPVSLRVPGSKEPCVAGALRCARGTILCSAPTSISSAS